VRGPLRGLAGSASADGLLAVEVLVVKSARERILSRVAARTAVRAAQRRGERVVFTNGCFDLLHVGHVRSLEQAKSLGDRLVVGVNRDASVRRLKGRARPVVGERQRAELLAALACVDWVVLFGEPTPLALIRALRPDVLAKGGDWRRGEIVGSEDVQSWGGRVERLRVVPGIRSTILVERARRS
jgi:D-beta-D-heptose 7-phosphate kinase/D-beta-D-heptose 1-phosphate adenosyltransferase